MDPLPVAKRSGLSGDDLKDALGDLRQSAETIDEQVKCLRTDIIHFAQFIHRPWEDDIGQADWWKRGAADDESNYQQQVGVFHFRMMFDTMHAAILYAPVYRTGPRLERKATDKPCEMRSKR